MGIDSFLNICLNILLYLWNSLVTTMLQIFIILGPGLILAILMNFIAGRVEKYAYGVLGSKVYLYTFGWLGTAVHETGHALFCVLFGHKINEMKLFSIDSYNGSLGYVNHSYNPDSLFQRIGNFFIGIGPILLGTIVIYYLSRYFLGEQMFFSSQNSTIDFHSFSTLNSIGIFFSNIFHSAVAIFPFIFSFENLTNWKFYLFIYLAFSIGSSITLSGADIEGAIHGFVTMFVALFLLNIITLWMSNSITTFFISNSRIFSTFYFVMVFAIILNVMAAAFFLLLSNSVSKTKTSFNYRMNKRENI